MHCFHSGNTIHLVESCFLNPRLRETRCINAEKLRSGILAIQGRKTSSLPVVRVCLGIVYRSAIPAPCHGICCYF
jgi:hypothetical protein